MDTCRDCDGTGHDEQECELCEGTGKLFNCSCDHCNGTGHEICNRCDGTGYSELTDEEIEDDRQNWEEDYERDPTY